MPNHRSNVTRLEWKNGNPVFWINQQKQSNKRRMQNTEKKQQQQKQQEMELH